MRTNALRLLWIGAFAVASVGIVGCDSLGLAHPVSNDGSCAGQLTACSNPGSCVGSATIVCNTPGSNILALTPDSQSLAVGEGTTITATYGGATLTAFADAALVPATISDSSIIAGSAFSARALAVGTASITATYNGSTTTVTFSVHPTAGGVSAAIFMNEDPNQTTSAWLPGTTHVQTGATVEFYPEVSHNVIFDAVPGAPTSIGLNTGIATRVFATPGTFPYHCSLHGEAGTIVVSP